MFSRPDNTILVSTLTKNVEKVIMKCPDPSIEIISVRLTGEPDYVIGIVELSSDSNTKTIYDFLNSPENKGKFCNKNGQVIEINLCFDASKLESEKWTAVVL